jgi:hypothetical protein
MATDIVQSLFGVTPQSYQRQQDALAETRALRFAELDPMQQATYGIYRGAGQLGGALGRALGGEDPELTRISLRQQIASQLDFNDPTSVQRAREALRQANDAAGLLQLDAVIRQAQESGALVRQREAAAGASDAAAKRERGPTGDVAKAMRAGEITRALQTPDLTDLERSGLQAELDLLRPPKEKEPTTEALTNARAFAATKGAPGTPEYNTAFRDKFSELIAKAPAAKNVKEVGVAEVTRKPVYLDVNNNEQFVFVTDAQGKQVRQPYVGGVDRTTAKVSATSQNIQEGEFSKQLGKAQADRYKSAVEARDAAIATIANYTELGKLNDQALISGAFASGRLGVANLFNTLGLTSAADSSKLASSEQYQKLAADALLATLGGKLGGQVSDSDREFVNRIVPQLENSPAARRELIAYMQKKNQKIAEEATRLIDFAENKRTLTGFVPTMPLFSAGGLQGLTDDELKRRYEAVKKPKEKK